jgi:hypothetical protein
VVEEDTVVDTRTDLMDLEGGDFNSVNSS